MFDLDVDQEELAKIGARPPYRTVGFFDHLGWSRFAEKYSLGALVSSYAGVAKMQKAAVSSLLEESAGNIGTVRFSDSTFIYAKDDSVESRFGVIAAGLGHLRASILVGLPIRGAITRGEALIDEDRNLGLGEAIVRAVQLEHETDWIGAVVETLEVFPGKSRRDLRKNLYDSGILVNYDDVPWKGASRRVSSLGWPIGFDFTEERLRRVLNPKEESLSSDAEQKLENTVEFLDFFLDADERRGFDLSGDRWLEDIEEATHHPADWDEAFPDKSDEERL